MVILGQGEWRSGLWAGGEQEVEFGPAVMPDASIKPSAARSSLWLILSAQN